MNTYEYSFFDKYGDDMNIDCSYLLLDYLSDKSNYSKDWDRGDIVLSHGITFDLDGNILIHSIEYINCFDRIEIK